MRFWYSALFATFCRYSANQSKSHAQQLMVPLEMDPTLNDVEYTDSIKINRPRYNIRTV